jgi:thymidylate synthase ThyX
VNNFQLKHKKLITKAGGVVNDVFVEKVGVMLTKKPTLTKQAKELFEEMNIDTIDTTDSEQHAEFNSRITYMAFKSEKTSSKEYNEKMIKEYGHRSVYNDEVITFLVAGCSLETMFEFVAHNEATVARLTSSKTKAQNNSLYRVRVNKFKEEFIELQKTMIQQVIKLREENICAFEGDEEEVFNVLNFGNKAVSFTISMSVKDWHKILIGRFSSSGVESEFIEILESLSEQLNFEYPQFFNTKEEYYAMSNAKKYEQ